MRLITIIIASIFCFTTQASAQSAKQIYESPNLKKVILSAKTAAVLPVNVSISYKKMPKGMTVENIRDEEKKESLLLQQGMYTYLLRKAKDYTVTVQEVERTNVLLKRAGIYDRLNEMLPDSICKALDVHLVIKSSWSYSKTGSEAGAIASTLLLGFGKSTASGQLTMQIYEAKTGEMIWRMSKEMDEGTFSSANELMERMMRKVGRNFPFEN